MNTVLIGDDTDLLVLLIYNASLEFGSLFFKPEPKQNTKNFRIWNIQAVKEHLGPEVCTHILFYMRFLDVIQHPNFTALEKVNL